MENDERRRERDHHRQRPGRLHGRAVHGARQPEPARDRGLRLGRPAAADDRRRELPGLPRGHHGPGDDAEVPRPGRALRRAPGDRRGRPRRARRASPAASTACGSATPSTAPARSSWRWAPSTRSSASPARRSSPGAASATARPATPPSSSGAPTIIVGGGDSAMEEAIFLSKFASKVTVVHRRDEFRASKIMLERARAQENIELLTPYAVERVRRRRERRARPRRADEHRDRRGARAARLGRLHRDRPRAAVASSSTARSTSTRTATSMTEGKSTRTNRPGVFAAGDLVDHTYRQAITAAGSGCQAALDAEWYLRDTPEVPTPEGMPEGDLAEAQWAPRGRRPRRLAAPSAEARGCRARPRARAGTACGRRPPP